MEENVLRKHESTYMYENEYKKSLRTNSKTQTTNLFYDLYLVIST